MEEVSSWGFVTWPLCCLLSHEWKKGEGARCDCPTVTVDHDQSCGYVMLLVMTQLLTSSPKLLFYVLAVNFSLYHFLK